MVRDVVHILEAADQSTGDRPTRYNHAACVGYLFESFI